MNTIDELRRQIQDVAGELERVENTLGTGSEVKHREARF